LIAATSADHVSNAGTSSATAEDTYRTSSRGGKGAIGGEGRREFRRVSIHRFGAQDTFCCYVEGQRDTGEGV